MKKKAVFCFAVLVILTIALCPFAAAADSEPAGQGPPQQGQPPGDGENQEGFQPPGSGEDQEGFQPPGSGENQEGLQPPGSGETPEDFQPEEGEGPQDYLPSEGRNGGRQDQGGFNQYGQGRGNQDFGNWNQQDSADTTDSAAAVSTGTLLNVGCYAAVLAAAILFAWKYRRRKI